EKALRSFSQLSFPLSDNLKNDFLLTNMNNDNNIQLNISKSYENQNELNPFYLLKKLKQNFECKEITNEIISEQNEFKFIITIDNQHFIGIDENKNIAKIKAAQYALEKLFGMCFHKQGK
ncbi:unnamed protein product, partial [Rotaria sp. Silwood1]